MKSCKVLLVLLAVGMLVFAGSPVLAAKPIIIGSPLSTAFLYGWDAERGIRLAIEEINAAGGVNVGGTKRPFAVEVIDTRDPEPGVPVSEALLAVEKLILDKEADFIVGGPVRSEAALAAMSLLSKYKKVSIVTTGVLTPKYHAMVAKQYDKFKYCFRIHGEAKQLVGEMFANFGALKKNTASTTCLSSPRMYPMPAAPPKSCRKWPPKRAGTSRGLKSIPPGPPTFPLACSKPRKPIAKSSTSGWTCPKAPSC
ncbi:MAG: hypothetical protein [Olavius algarvensis Delta 4 endosymbiont]|nr:MAG: hypothetical protein [Olavius algarvensis Delta 4 endosymbiont]